MSKEGKTNLKIIFISLLLLVVMSVMVFGLTTLTILKPTANNFTQSTGSNISVIFEINTSNTIYLNISSVVVYFNGTYTNGTSQSNNVLCSPNNASGVIALANGSAFSNESARFNCTGNATAGFGKGGNWTIWVNATNSTAAASQNLMNFTVYTIDVATPTITAQKPFSTTDPTTVNYTNFPVNFMVNITDVGNGLLNIWYIINTLNSALGSNETNSSANASQFAMSSNASVPQTYVANITLKFAVSSRSPGPHSVYFCANDSAGNQNCTGPYNYIVKGGNYSDLLLTITGSSSGDATFSVNFTYENGTNLPLNTTTDPNPHFFAPTLYNYTVKMNFTVPVGASGTVPVSVYLVGMAINETQMASMNDQNISTTPPSSIREQVGGAGYNQSLAWLDVANFLPSFVFFKFGIIKYIGYQAFEKISMCNGTSVDSASCLQINPCPSTPIVAVDTSQSNYSFIATQTGYNSSNLSLNQTIGACYVLDAGNTSIYTHRFSGGAATDDATPPSVTLNSPTNGTNSTNVTLPINFTINDTGGSGFSNASGFLNLTVDGILYTYPTNLTCLPNTINVTGMTCFMNRSQALKENSSLQIVVNVDDASGNRQNSTFVIKTDRTVPSYITWNATNSYNSSQGGGISSGNTFNFSGTSLPSLGPSLSQSAKQGDTITLLINWSDAISGGGGINSRTATLEVLNSTDGLFHVVNSTTVIAANITNGSIGTNGTPPYGNDSWTNFTWVIPAGHLYTEGANITYRVNLSDVLGNLNSTISGSVSNGTGTMNFSFTVNDTQLPNVTVRIGTSSLTPVNNSLVNLSGTTIVINWSVNDSGGMRKINVSVDNATEDTGCGEFVPYGPTVINNRLNYQIQYPASGCSGSSVKGIESGALTNGTHNITFTAEDSWGNLFRKYVSFNIDNQPPGLTGITVTAASRSAADVNNTNIRFNDTFAINITDAGSAGLGENASRYATGCNTTNVSFTLNSQIAPFNTSGCRGVNLATNLTLFYNDSAGNANSTIFFFRLDDVAPTFVSTSITNGTSGSNFTVRWNVTDAFMNVTNVGFYIDNASGYTDTNVTGNMFNYSNGTGQIILNLSSLLGQTYISGRHFIVLTANDSINNIVNSSPIYFTVDAPLPAIDFVSNLTAVFNSSGNVTRIELYALQDDPNILSNATSLNLTNGTITTNRNFKIVMVTNTTGINLTLSKVNGTEVNWGANFTLTTNNTLFKNAVDVRYGKNTLHSVYLDNSFDRFLPNNNAYFAVITLPYGPGNYSAIYWFEDENSLNTTTDATTLSACGTASTFDRTTTTPCYTDNNSYTIVLVPHLSAIVAANDTTAPYINPNFPVNRSVGVNITNSSFVVSFTTSLDVSACYYSIGGVSNQSMSISGTSLNKTCTGGLTNISHNSQTVINLTTTDGANVRTITFGINITDEAMAAIDETSIKNSSIANTSVVITWNTTEYTNSTVTYEKVTGGTPANATNVQLVLNHSITLSGLSTETKYNFTVRSCDFSGNCNSSSSQFNFTTSVSAASTTTGGGTTSGGGGGAAAPTTTNIASSKAQVFASVAAGSSAVVNVNKAEIAITQVEVSVAKDVTNAEIKVSSLKDKPTDIVAGNKVYQYLDIAPKNIGTTDVSKVIITFKVTRDWLTSNGLSSEDVVLSRYASGSWTELQTKVVSSDGTSVTYSAESPGFSYYAVTVKAVAAPPAPKVEAPKPEEKPVVPEEKKPLEKAKEKVEEAGKAVAEKVGISTTAMTWIIIIAVVIIGLVAYFIYARRSRE